MHLLLRVTCIPRTLRMLSCWCRRAHMNHTAAATTAIATPNSTNYYYSRQGRAVTRLDSGLPPKMDSSTSSSRKSDSPMPREPYTDEPSTTTSVTAVREDEYSDLEAEAEMGALDSEPLVHKRTAPWASLLQRHKARLYALPGVQRTVDITNKILGPKIRREPSLPTSKALLCAVTSGRRRMSTTLDTLCVRFTRRFSLDYFWLLYLALWIMGFVLLIRSAYYASGPPTIGCTVSMWDNWPPDVCGLDGEACRAYMEPGTFRCPGGCQNVPLGNPRWVGNEKVNGKPLLIGGLQGSPYR